MSDALSHTGKIYTASSPIPHAGRGVFAAMPIKAGEIIEQCPVIEMTEEGIRAKLQEISLRDYYFIWGENKDCAAIALGFGSIYNHSFEPNARYVKQFAQKRIDFVALCDIPQNEEITVNYNGDPADKSPLWEGALIQ